jgi:hypothetical protein
MALHRPAEFNKSHIPACIASGTAAATEVLESLESPAVRRRQPK